MMLTFFRQAHELLSDEGKFLLVFTNTCYQESGYQPDGGPIEGNMTYWHKWAIDDVVPLLLRAKLRPVSVRMQRSIEGACGVEPFVLILERG